MDQGRNLQLRVRISFAVRLYLLITALFLYIRAWGGEVDDDGQVCGNQKESGTSNRPATSQETTSFLA